MSTKQNTGRTYGFWVNEEEEDLVKRFDSTFNGGEGAYSRSQAIKDAMELAILMERMVGNE